MGNVHIDRIELLEHRVDAIRLALANLGLRDDVRTVLEDHLAQVEVELALAREHLAA